MRKTPPKRPFMEDVRLHKCDMWGYYNFDKLLGVEMLQKSARIKAVEFTGLPWNKSKKYIQLRKVTIREWW